MSKISLIGNIGSGKTTLLEHYSNTIDPIATAYEPFLNNFDNYYNGNISAFEFQLYVITKLCERNRTYNKTDVLMERNLEELKTDFKEYKKNNQTNYKQIYEIIEMNDIEITLLDSCYGSQKFADNIYTKLILSRHNIFMINNLR